MAKAEYVQIGNTIDYPNATNKEIKYGDVIVMPGCLGIARTDIPAGEVGSVGITEAYTFQAAEAIPIGSPVYWNVEDNVITAAAEGNIPAGICLSNKTDTAAGTVVVRLSPSVTAMAAAEAGA